MRIHCSQCERHFEADDAKAAGVQQVTCICGATVRLRESARWSERIGRYAFVNQIAIGGMGEVWFALMTGSHGFEKEVAVKRLLPRYGNDQQFTQMLFKEARISALMKHPNVAEVYDLAHVDGQYLIVMEYVAGVPVSDIIATAVRVGIDLPWEFAAVAVIQLLRGLGYAHRLPRSHGYKTFIHRDISPQNLLMTEEGLVKVVDFGISKPLHEASNTAPGTLLGKVCYQTPERLHGAPVTEHVDLFPAAIILYECWAMQHLFRGQTQEETMHKVALTVVPPLNLVRKDVSAALEQVMRRGLAQDPSSRYDSARAFEAALLEACAPHSFEQMQAQVAAFLEHHTSLFFSAITSHKVPPGVMPEATRNILVQAGVAPDVSHILRALPVQEPNQAETSKPRVDPVKTPWPQKRPSWTLVLASWAVTAASVALFVRGPKRDVEAAMEAPVEAAAPVQSAPVQNVAATAPADHEPNARAVPPATPAPTSSYVPLNSAAATPAPEAQKAELPPPATALSGAEAQTQGDAADTLRPAPGPAELNKYFRRRSGFVMQCLENVSQTLRGSLTVDLHPNGTLDAHDTTDTLKPYEACLVQKIKHLRFSPFHGDKVSYVLPLRVDPPDEPAKNNVPVE